MSIFNQKSKFKVKAEVRSVRQAVEPRPRPRPTKQSSSHLSAPHGRPTARASSSTGTSTTPRGAASSARRIHSASPLPSSLDGTTSSSRKRRAGVASSASPSNPTFTSSDDSDGDGDEGWEDNLDARKRRKRANQGRAILDPNRSLRHPKLWTGDETEVERIPIIHAADVASLEQKCLAVMGLAPGEVAVKLQYPGSRYPERYELVSGKDKIEAVRDIIKVVNYVASTYLTDDEAKAFLDQTSGICRRLEKSRNTGDGAGFKAALREHNERLRAHQRKGHIAKNLDAMRGLPRDLVAFILDQIYDRTVAPNIELLAKYKNGSDNVYGELLHPFISNILERTKVSSDKVFVDLGSGVGNVVLQAALELGCESWGCEMMENACNLAEAQKREFSARCRLWGIAAGEVHLERGDFRKNDKILAALKRADVVLVNNQAFTSQLNDNLVSMFLDLKPGCKIVSLKTFVHDNKNAENDVATSILDVEHLTYPEEYVSWTSVSGTFCISTKKGYSAATTES
ncbi:histone-lysine N-methyltransferase, H3 lysine-79 specific [Cercophora scortea]|uniref:Histone-lysine N-methyltransferase, H3 lysine-79 specific n=1 Tax=Cercophora scortea TaxID=314031 RepID=A0AAE0IXW0_9PEZI|nr:histone-lysine N-methyltransferase, H3 lysine-79 specific [Cercophora scortea]